MTASTRRACILIVDDSPTVLRVMEGVLTQAGYEVVCLESGAEAVATAKVVHPDLFFIDFAMPDMSGFAVCHALGSDPALESIPIVLMHTRGDAVANRFLRSLGVVDHITKPFAPEVLLAVTEHTLEKASGVPLAPRLTPAPPPRRAAEPTTPERADAWRMLAERLAAALGGHPADAVAAALAQQSVRDAVLAAARGRDGGMALHGDLGIVPISEVLQVLAMQRHTGFLKAQQEETQIAIALESGSVRLVTATGIAEEFLLGSILVQERLMTVEELELLLGNRRGSRLRIGKQIVKLGYINRADLQKALKRQSAELVYELLRWNRGDFWFERCAALPAEVLELEESFSVEELLMEGFRRVDEWGLVGTVIESFDCVPVRMQLGPDPGGHNLTTEERLVLDAIDGQRDVRAIVRAVGRSSFEVARILYRLVGGHLVVMKPAGDGAGPRGDRPPDSLLGRL
jgi:CheY-like chemotaxis protein